MTPPDTHVTIMNTYAKGKKVPMHTGVLVCTLWVLAKLVPTEEDGNLASSGDCYYHTPKGRSHIGSSFLLGQPLRDCDCLNF